MIIWNTNSRKKDVIIPYNKTIKNAYDKSMASQISCLWFLSSELDSASVQGSGIFKNCQLNVDWFMLAISNYRKNLPICIQRFFFLQWMWIASLNFEQLFEYFILIWFDSENSENLNFSIVHSGKIQTVHGGKNQIFRIFAGW